jgi:hypothetical protein
MPGVDVGVVTGVVTADPGTRPRVQPITKIRVEAVTVTIKDWSFNR